MTRDDVDCAIGVSECGGDINRTEYTMTVQNGTVFDYSCPLPLQSHIDKSICSCENANQGDETLDTCRFTADGPRSGPLQDGDRCTPMCRGDGLEGQTRLEVCPPARPHARMCSDVNTSADGEGVTCALCTKQDQEQPQGWVELHGTSSSVCMLSGGRVPCGARA